ncbi:MAG: hypothetical protein ABI196_18225 [Bradyrhizobium sp.]
MNELERFSLKYSPTNSRLSAQKGKRVAISLLAALIVLVMIVWFSFLGWGIVAVFQLLLDSAKKLSYV